MIGQTISHYKITAKLGEGGMGVVNGAADATPGSAAYKGSSREAIKSHFFR